MSQIIRIKVGLEPRFSYLDFGRLRPMMSYCVYERPTSVELGGKYSFCLSSVK